MTYRTSIKAKNEQIDGVFSALNSGFIQLYAGSPPAAIGDAPAGALLATLTLNNPASVGASAGVGAGTAIGTTTAIAAGTIGYGVVETSLGEAMFDGTVSLPAGGGDIECSIVDVLLDDIVQLISFTITAP